MVHSFAWKQVKRNVSRMASGCFLGHLCQAAFGDFWKKMTKRTWLCAGISPLLYGLQTWSKCQRHGKSSSLQSKKFLCLGGAGFLWVTSQVEDF